MPENYQKETAKAGVPYLKLGKVLLECIFNALEYLIKLEIKNLGIENLSTDSKKIITGLGDKEEIGLLNSLTEELRKFFDPFLNDPDNIKPGNNPHFFIGNTKNEGFKLRLTKIILTNYKEVQDDSKANQGFCIPSPLSILYQILTVPDEPQSAAYAVLFCRSLLFETFEVFPEHPFIPKEYESFNISDINSALDTFFSITKISQNIPQSEKKPTQLMLAHYLAMRGVFYLRFGSIGRNATISREDQLLLAKKYLSSKNLSVSKDNKKHFEFHKFSYYDELPKASSLMNELCGIPIPVRGAETIFHGGLSTDSKSNLTIRISGEPGSGKTSFALALCAIMSPFNTFSYYISLEENPKDLSNRLYSLIPGYLKKLTIYNADVDSWFKADKVSIGTNNRLDYFESNYIDKINKILEEKSKIATDSLPAVCPIIIVIDSIRILLNDSNSSINLEKFIEKCKKRNAIVILISSNDEKFHHEIDYMVDVVIHLKHSGTETQKDKPTRILHLSKTRHQISRPGSHVFHLSGQKGLRISPQLPSQIDRKEKIAKPIASDEYYIDFFEKYGVKTELKVSDKSHILLHGYGSSGKAGFSLSLLLAPIKEKKAKSSKYKSNINISRRRVLIVSLLYPEQYYKNLGGSIFPKLYPKQNKANLKSMLDCIYFYPGYLTPEDFISKILKRIDAAILEGEPYTGILLDGLHNVSLQFHKLQENDMLWPTLYSLLAKYRLTIVTTFTNFVIDTEKKKGSYDDDEILLKGHKPLLHAMIQATDYHFSVHPSNENEKKYEGKYIVTLKSAIRHKLLNNEKFVWDRERLRLSEYISEKPKDSISLD